MPGSRISPDFNLPLPYGVQDSSRRVKVRASILQGRDAAAKAANNPACRGSILPGILGFTRQDVNKYGNASELACGNARGKGIAFECGGSGNTRWQTNWKTRNQILHPKELEWSDDRPFLT
jgi:hypothetical protein